MNNVLNIEYSNYSFDENNYRSTEKLLDDSIEVLKLNRPRGIKYFFDKETRVKIKILNQMKSYLVRKETWHRFQSMKGTNLENVASEVNN